MQDADNRSRKTPSPWPFALVPVLLAPLSWYLLGAYGTLHSAVDRDIALKLEVEGLWIESQIDGSGVVIEPARVARLRELTEESLSRTSKARNRLEIYHLTGLVAFLCSVVALMRKPRWVGILALPFGLLGLFCLAA